MPTARRNRTEITRSSHEGGFFAGLDSVEGRGDAEDHELEAASTPSAATMKLWMLRPR